MAKHEITYSCGHTGEVQLYGPHKDRERKIEWYEQSASCPECYKAKMRAAEAAAGPTIAVRSMPAFDPQRTAEHYRAQAILKSIDVDRIEEAGGGRHLAGAQTAVAAEERTAAYHARQPAREARIEIVITNSYSVRGLLKARGYRYDPEGAVQGGPGYALLAPGKPAWTMVIPASNEQRMAAEFMWLQEQGWALPSEPTSLLDDLMSSLLLGRAELLPAPAGDTVAGATAAREAARVQRAQARAEFAAAAAVEQDMEAKLRTVRVVESSRDADNWRAQAADGRVITGMVLDGDWAALTIQTPGQPAIELGHTSQEADRIGRDARSMAGS